MTPRRHAVAGLTLIEAVVTLAVLAILATLTLPSFGALLGRHRLAAAAEGLAADLSQARFHAAQTGQATYVSFRAGADWCYAVSAAPGCGCESAAAACQLKAVRAADLPGVTLAAAGGLRFDPQATVNAPSPIRWTAGDRALEVRLSGLGRARVCSPDGQAGQAAC